MDDSIVGRVHKVDLKKITNVKFYHKSEKDSLTGLMKYDDFLKVVRDYIKNNISTGMGLAIVYSDIRHFKIINDTYGHSLGDNVIETFAKSLTEASPLTLAACRMYSDNILTAAPYDNSWDADVFVRAISDHNHNVEAMLQQRFAGQHIVINTGIFIASSTDNLDAEIAISNANLARKHAKVIEASDAVLFNMDMINNLAQQMELSSSLPHAIENEELKVFYQPKIECGSEKVIGAEALIRWLKPNGTFVYPNQFIPLFESNGLIVEVDYFVYRKVFEFIKYRIDNHLPVVPISMNVSRVHLASDDIVEYVKNLFEEYQIPPELIEFELTENIYIENINIVLPLINKLKALGVKISIDDFGSGYSCLNELNILPIDTIKLDKVFMKETLDNKQQIILTSIIEMAKKLNTAVLCEGVENMGQNDFLRRVGCDMVQGYYYSKPLREEDFVEYIKHRLNETVRYIHFPFDHTLFDDTERFECKIIGNGVTYSNGPANMAALHFSGGSPADNLVELPVGIYPPSNYTFTMWFREDEEQLSSALMYTSFQNGYSSLVPHSSDMKAMFRIKDMVTDCSDHSDAAGILSPRRGAWNFVAISYNYRTQVSSLYLNGLPAGRCSNVPMMREPMRVLLGGDVYHNTFIGSIADLRIYNQELTAIEILYAFNEFHR